MKKLCCFVALFFCFLPLIGKASESYHVDITTASIEEIQAAVSAGQIDYETLMNLYLERIAAYDERYRSIITVNSRALEEAKEKDREYQKQGATSPLFGLPVVVKDNIDVVGMPTTSGSKALLDAYPYQNAEVIQTLIDAGAIIIGKANMSEFAFAAGNSYSSFGNTYNAYNPLYTPYGSSGGVAVAVALNFAVAGIGTDTNASVRLPASANNLVGFRPTFGTLSSDGILQYDSTRDTAGILTRYVRDNEIVYDILAEKEEQKAEIKRIGVLSQFMSADPASSIELFQTMDTDIRELTEKALEILESVGYELVQIDNFYTEHYHSLVTNTMLGSSLCENFDSYIQNTNSRIKSFEQLFENGNYVQNLEDNYRYCGSGLEKNKSIALDARKLYQDYINEVMEEYDVEVFVYPSVKNKVFPIEEYQENFVMTNSYTIAPLAGYPAVSMPMGMIEGLPYGIEFLTFRDREDILYEVAAVFEDATSYYQNPEAAPSLYTFEEPQAVSNPEDIVTEEVQSIPFSWENGTLLCACIVFLIYFLFCLKNYIN